MPKCVYTAGMRASDRAHLTLREEIIAGDLAPGSVLAEVEQSARLGISRTPLREALGRLVADGLAAPSAGRGVVVTAVSLDEAAPLFDLRIALEVLAVRRSAENAQHDPAARELFSGLAVRFEDAVAPLWEGAEPSEYYALTEELDRAIDSTSGNAYLTDSLRTVRIHLVRLRRLSRHSPERLAESAREHAAIARAVAGTNPELAAAATVMHLQHALSHLRTAPLPAPDPPPPGDPAQPSTASTSTLGPEARPKETTA
ncbi:GntR family transcriptional regulator [Brachybacterium alimentarium]